MAEIEQDADRFVRQTATEMAQRLGRAPTACEVGKEYGMFWYGVAEIIPDLPQPTRFSDPLVRGAVWAKTQGMCWYCGVQTNPFINFTVDHIEPRVFGCGDELSNLVPCCDSCNSRKRDRHWSVLRVWMGCGDPTALLYFEEMGLKP